MSKRTILLVSAMIATVAIIAVVVLLRPADIVEPTAAVTLDELVTSMDPPVRYDALEQPPNSQLDEDMPPFPTPSGSTVLMSQTFELSGAPAFRVDYLVRASVSEIERHYADLADERWVGLERVQTTTATAFGFTDADGPYDRSSLLISDNGDETSTLSISLFPPAGSNESAFASDDRDLSDLEPVREVALPEQIDQALLLRDSHLVAANVFGSDAAAFLTTESSVEVARSDYEQLFAQLGVEVTTTEADGAVVFEWTDATGHHTSVGVGADAEATVIYLLVEGVE